MLIQGRAKVNPVPWDGMDSWLRQSKRPPSLTERRPDFEAIGVVLQALWCPSSKQPRPPRSSHQAKGNSGKPWTVRSPQNGNPCTIFSLHINRPPIRQRPSPFQPCFRKHSAESRFACKRNCRTLRGSPSFAFAISAASKTPECCSSKCVRMEFLISRPCFCVRPSTRGAQSSLKLAKLSRNMTNVSDDD